MIKLIDKLRGLAEERTTAIVEYSFITVGIVAVIVGALALVAGQIASLFSTIFGGGR